MADDLDPVDARILDILQQDAGLSVAEVADRVGLSASPCWRRIKKLEDAGFIDKRVALLNQKALNLRMTAFVMIKTSQHDEAWLKQFSDGVRQIPEIVEIHRMAGDVDYLLKLVADLP